ncbi:MAG: hypothetical protein WDZ51_17720 [Pirellulaceae bacterium]
MQPSTQLQATWVICLAFGLTGCVDAIDLSQTALGPSLEALEKGSPDQAVVELLRIDWSNLEFEELPSEQKFVWQNSQRQQEILDRLTRLRDLALAAMSAAENADAEGNKELAHKCRQAVADMGEHLSQSHLCKCVREMGIVITRIRNGDLEATRENVDEP